MAKDYDFSGVWRSTYRYISHSRGNEPHESEHYVTLHKKGNQLVVESLPTPDGSYVLLRLTLDGRVATGTWEEQTSPTGYYKGVRFYGAIQLVLDDAGTTFKGKWVGHDRNLNTNANDWELTHIGQHAPNKSA